MRLHDLRHTYASAGVASVESLNIVGSLAGTGNMRRLSATLTSQMIRSKQQPIEWREASRLQWKREPIPFLWKTIGTPRNRVKRPSESHANFSVWKISVGNTPATRRQYGEVHVAIRKKVIEEGIWRRETRTVSSSDNPKDKKIFLESLAVASAEEGAKKYLFEMRDWAKSVLLEAGYPEKECGYGLNDDKTWFELGGPAHGLGVKRTFIWPFFPDIEALTEEEFARDLIFRIDCLLDSAESEEDPWAIVYKALNILGPYYTLRAEASGVATHAYRVIETLRRLNKARDDRLEKIQTIRAARKQHAEELTRHLWETNAAHRGNASRTARLIRGQVEQLVRAQFLQLPIDDLNISFSVRTIGRDLSEFGRVYRSKKK